LNNEISTSSANAMSSWRAVRHYCGHWTVNARGYGCCDFDRELAGITSGSLEAEADAQLMAAAPALLECCQMALDFISSWEEGENIKTPSKIHVALKQAIRLAGER
jgi:hypothetical protein